MKNNLTLTALVLLSVFGLISCEEDIDITNPTVIISSPVNGDVFSVADEVEVVGRATDDFSLRNVLITSDLGIDETFSEFDDSSDFPFIITISIEEGTPSGDYEIVIKAVDTSDNEAETSVNITLQ